MVPEDLLFWIEAFDGTDPDMAKLLCRRHADAMIVPRGWTLDDRRNGPPRLFQPQRFEQAGPETEPPKAGRRRSKTTNDAEGEQLQFDGTGPIPRPPLDEIEPEQASTEAPTAPWQPDFDQNDDLGGLLSASSPLLARAFRGTDRPRAT